MKAHIKHKLRVIVVAVLILLFTLPVLAQSGGGYDLSWSTVDGGGGSSTGGIYLITGTSGQIDAGLMSGEDFTLKGGFWLGGAPAEPGYALFLPLIIK